MIPEEPHPLLLAWETLSDHPGPAVAREAAEAVRAAGSAWESIRNRLRWRAQTGPNRARDSIRPALEHLHDRLRKAERRLDAVEDRGASGRRAVLEGLLPEMDRLEREAFAVDAPLLLSETGVIGAIEFFRQVKALVPLAILQDEVLEVLDDLGRGDSTRWDEALRLLGDFLPHAEQLKWPQVEREDLFWLEEEGGDFGWAGRTW